MARRLVTQALGSQPEPATDHVLRRAVVATSELVANVVRHTRTAMDLEIRRTPDGWLVAVSDEEPAEPRLQTVDLLSESGRGLLIVRRSTDRSGWTPTSRGKVVWFELWDQSDAG